MGLVEKRKMKELQEITLPERQKDIEQICGVEIPYIVDWDSFNNDLEGLNFLDNLSCHRLNMALRVICMDEMGKEAIREGLSQIQLKNVADKKDMHLRFANGVLEMHLAYAQRTDGMFSDNQIREELLKGL